jgi:cytochrome c peroxidase
MIRIAAALAVAVTLLAADVADPPAEEFSPAEVRRILQHSPLADVKPSSSAVADDPRAASLGHALFFDARLSSNGEISCATCHDPARGFTDGKPVGEALGVVDRNTPTIWNAAHQRWLFWDGRADSLWSQALQPIENPLEMGSSRLAVAHLVAGDQPLRDAYQAIFGALPELADRARFPPQGRPAPARPEDPLHQAWSAMAPADQQAVDRIFVNVGKALEAYQRRLVSRNSSFDRFVEGLRRNDVQAMQVLSPEARRGLKLFIGRGECRLCHSGANFSDGEFHDIRVPPRNGGMPLDAGRYEGIRALLASPFNAAGPHSDDRDGLAAQRLRFLAQGPHLWGAFKTPSLRNVALTAPYMHQGQFESLERVVEYYSTLEGAVRADHHDETVLVPRQFTPAEKADLIAFLHALTDVDSIDPALLRPP